MNTATVYTVRAITGETVWDVSSTVLAAYTSRETADEHARLANLDAKAARVHMDDPEADWDTRDTYADDNRYHAKAYIGMAGVAYKVSEVIVSETIEDAVSTRHATPLPSR